MADDLKPLGTALRAQLANDRRTVLDVLNSEEELANNSWGRASIDLRDIYTTPLNLLQAELLRRERANPDRATERA